MFFLLSMSVMLSSALAKDTIIIGIQDTTASLDPAKTYDEVSQGITKELLYERLITFEGDDFTQAVPELAESWEQGEDKKTWTFHIRKEVSFASGNPVNADSVVFSLHRAIKIQADPAWLLTQFGLSEETITKIDEYTVQLVLDQQYAPNLFLSCLAFNIASIVDQKLVMEHEQNGDMGSAWLEEHSAGSGPFVLDESKRGESYTFLVNEGYWKDKPITKQIIVKNIEDPFEQALILDKGEIDIAWNLQPDTISRLETNPDIQIFETPTLITVHFVMNQGYPPLAKPEVRKAIRYAIDYDGIVDFILQGAAVKTQTFLPSWMLGYNPAMPYDFDIEKAKQLMADAGYSDGFDVELTCLNFPPWPTLAITLKNDLKEIGIQVKIIQTDVPGMIDAYVSRNFQLHLWQWQPDYIDPDSNAKAFAHSDSAGDDATVKSVVWFSKYVNVETSKLVEQAALEEDTTKRELMYQKITNIILEDGPFAILYEPKKQYGIQFDARESIGIPSVLWVNFPTIL